jgi:DNA invertase Pin-like site-specific DNA recombinase
MPRQIARMTKEQKAQVLKLLEDGVRQREICTLTGLNRWQVASVAYRKKHGSGSKPGRPVGTTGRRW